MNVTLNDLTTISQLNDGNIILHKKKVNIHSVAVLIMQMLQFLKGNKDISLHSNISVHFPLVIADENRLIQILFNLVHNAIKYGDEGEVIIDAFERNNEFVISVSNSGQTLTAQNIEQIFQPYERLQADSSKHITGIGIGLSVTKQLVELHGGKISLQ